MTSHFDPGTPADDALARDVAAILAGNALAGDAAGRRRRARGGVRALLLGGAVAAAAAMLVGPGVLPGSQHPPVASSARQVAPGSRPAGRLAAPEWAHAPRLAIAAAAIEPEERTARFSPRPPPRRLSPPLRLASATPAAPALPPAGASVAARPQVPATAETARSSPPVQPAPYITIAAATTASAPPPAVAPPGPAAALPDEPVAGSAGKKRHDALTLAAIDAIHSLRRQ